MTFRSWLRSQTKRDDAVGDIARDVTADECMPNDQPEEMLNHIIGYHGSVSNELQNAYAKAVSEFKGETE